MVEENVKLNERIAVLENQSHQVSLLLEKLETTIDRLSDVSRAIKELIAIHDHRISKVEIDIKNNMDDLVVTEHQHDARIHEVKDLLTSVSSALNMHIKSEENSLDEQSESLKEIKASIFKMGERIGALEKWRWLVVGAAAVAYFVFTFGTKIVTEGYTIIPPKADQPQTQQVPNSNRQ